MAAFSEPPAAVAPVDAYAEAVAHRRAGRHVQAVAGFRNVLASRPADVDALLGLGLSLLAQEQTAEAEAALARAVELAPEYWDAHVGLARAAAVRGDLPAARARLARVAAQQPDHADALALSSALSQAAEAEARPAPAAERPLRRLDLFASRSDLSAGRSDWREAGLVLSLPQSSASTVQLGLEATERFGAEDVFFRAGFRRRAAGGSAWEVSLGGTPDADHRPELVVGAGLSAPVGPATTFTLEGAWARYPLVEVTSFIPGVEILLHPRLTLVGKLIGVAPSDGERLSGYAARADIVLDPLTRLSLGWSDAPESSEGRPIPVEALSLGAARDLNDRLTLRLTGTHEERSAVTRDEIALGAAVRF